MPTFQQTARALALEALLAHFPNPGLIALSIERTYGARIARELARQMEKLRRDLQRDLQKIDSTKKTVKS